MQGEKIMSNPARLWQRRQSRPLRLAGCHRLCTTGKNILLRSTERRTYTYLHVKGK
jgi:hypothetical protein